MPRELPHAAKPKSALGRILSFDFSHSNMQQSKTLMNTVSLPGLVLSSELLLHLNPETKSLQLEQNTSDSYAPKEVLGEGAFGTVQRVVDLTSRKSEARKTFDLLKLSTEQIGENCTENNLDAISAMKQKRSLRRQIIHELKAVAHELDLWSQLDSQFIVALHGFEVQEEAKLVHIYMEHCAFSLGTILNTYTENELPELSLDLLKAIFSGIALALRHLHEHDIIHLDIKSDQILLSYDGTAKLCDFGVSRKLSGAVVRSTQQQQQQQKKRSGKVQITLSHNFDSDCDDTDSEAGDDSYSRTKINGQNSNSNSNSNTKNERSLKFTPAYVSPEVFWLHERHQSNLVASTAIPSFFSLKNKSSATKSDVWSLGITLLETVVGINPFLLCSHNTLRDKFAGVEKLVSLGKSQSYIEQLLFDAKDWRQEGITVLPDETASLLRHSFKRKWLKFIRSKPDYDLMSFLRESLVLSVTERSSVEDLLTSDFLSNTVEKLTGTDLTEKEAVRKVVKDFVMSRGDKKRNRVKRHKSLFFSLNLLRLLGFARTEENKKGGLLKKDKEKVGLIGEKSEKKVSERQEEFGQIKDIDTKKLGMSL